MEESLNMFVSGFKEDGRSKAKHKHDMYFYSLKNCSNIQITYRGGANQSKSFYSLQNCSNVQITYSTGGARARKKQRRVKERKLYISEQLVEQILIRLPVKSLLRFKSVSKTWRSLIQSRYFIDSHRRHQYYSRRYHDDSDHELFFTSHADTNKSLLDDPSPSSSIVLMPPEITRFDDGQEEGWRCVVRTMGPTSNGIYCLVSNLESINNDGLVSILTGKIAFFNPATQDYKFTSSFPSSEYSLLSDLARKPCRVRYGFGATSNNDYKVVVVISWGPCFSSFLSFVYSLRSGVWTKVVDYEHDKRGYQEEQYPEITPDLELCPQRFLNGSWHWMGVNRDCRCSVLSFNLDDDAFYSFAAPDCYTYDHQGDPTSEGEFGGALSLVLNHHLAAIFFSTDPCSLIHVWMMMEYGAVDSWTKIYAIQPNFNGAFSRLVGISLLHPPPSHDYDNDNDNGGATRIQSILFEDRDSKKLITFDDLGYSIEDQFYDFSSAIWWNTLGISTKVDTLEPLYKYKIAFGEFLP